MYLIQDVEYYSSNETINDLPTEWPIKTNNCPKQVLACNICFYPIAFEKHMIHEIRSENNISFAIVIPIRKLFKKVGIIGKNYFEQWRNTVYCLSCGTILSFMSTYGNPLTPANVIKMQQLTNIDDEIVILWSRALFRGSAIEAKSRFEQIIEF